MERVTLAGLLREHARKRPDDAALASDVRESTYAELDERTSRLAQALKAAGVGEGDRVAHLDQNAPECVELLFAAAKLGSVLVPLNWRLAKPELEVVVKDADARLIVCGPDYADTANALGADKVVTAGDEYEAWIAGFDPEDPGFEADGDDVAFQLYTSGTTGRPKGVLTTNGNLDGLSKVSTEWRVDEASVAMVAMPLFHIGGSGWLLVAMANGAKVVLVRAIDPPKLLDTMESEKVSNAFLVPTVLGMLCQIDGAADRDWSNLRSIAYGASPITTTTLKAALKTFGCPLFQVYGLTETTGAIVQLDADDHDPDGPREHLLRSAGKPYDWMELKIVDPDSGEERPAGEIGEVRLRGPSVMPGYFNLEEETRDAFDDDGFLRTGDGGYVDEEGYLFLTDRIKDMIVSGAENVYPIEVEEALASHEAVGEVAVIGLPDEKWGEIVTAIVVARDGDVDTDALKAHARERLAGYKLPRRFEIVDELPKTQTGKVLKKDLRERFAEAGD